MITVERILQAIFSFVVQCVVVAAVMFPIIFALEMWRKHQLNNLLQNSAMSTGKGIRYSQNKSTWIVKFQFKANGKYYQTSQSFSCSEGRGLVGRYVPIIYETDNPENSHALVLRSHFTEVNRVCPDSMERLYSDLCPD